MNIRGYIYLLETEDWYYKIGLTKELTNRIRTLKIQLPYPVTLKHAVPVLSNLRQAERYIHNRFDKYRMNGEWFSLSDKAVEWFCSLTAGDIDVLMNDGWASKAWTTWETLCEIEPRLKNVESHARSLGRTNSQSFTSPFYRYIKPQIVDLVGWYAKAKGQLIHSAAAYETVYFYLLDLTAPYAGEEEENEEEW